jgi:hypothetical protein
MSEENVEIVRRAYEGGDFLANATSESWDRAFREYLDEKFELRLPPDHPEGEPVFRGRDGVDQYIATLRESWRECGPFTPVAPRPFGRTETARRPSKPPGCGGR